jgi:hypothetical protein
MPLVRANPNQYLLAGRGGRLENRGSAVQSYLLPGTVFVLVPADKQEASFEFTQETRDGIPLRFKGIVIFRVSEPLVAAARFNFVKPGLGINQVSELLTHVVLGELRHAVSHMTMQECIEQRKTTLSQVVADGLDETIHRQGEDWGISIEVAQLAQVFIVDSELRGQLEAEVRNEIKLRSDQSDIHAAEEAKLAAMASGQRVAEQQLAADREAIRRAEALAQAETERQRRAAAEELITRQEAVAQADALFLAEQASDAARLEAEIPVLRERIARETEIAAMELVLRQQQAAVQAAEVDRDLARARAEQALRMELLPIEQQPAIVKAASGVFRGANLSIYGEQAELLGQLAPVFELLGRSVRRDETPVG